MAVEKESTYRKEVSIKCADALKSNLYEMPDFVTKYFNYLNAFTTPRTRVSYSYDIRTFLDWVYEFHLNKSVPSVKDIKLETVYSFTSSEIADYYGYISGFGTTAGVSRKLCAISSMYEWFCVKNYIIANPCLLVKKPKSERSSRVIRMHDREVADFLNAIKNGDDRIPKASRKYLEKTRTRDYAIAMLLLGTGIRVSECVGIDFNHYHKKDEAHSFLDVFRKGKVSAQLGLSSEVKEAFEAYLEQRKLIKPSNEADKDAVFLSLKGNRMSIHAVEAMITKYAKIVGCEYHITPHKLRKTYGTKLYELTGNINIVADKLGHRDVNTTRNHYIADDTKGIDDDILTWTK